MMMFRWWLWEAVAILLVGATLVDARTMTVKDRARLRQGPAATSPLVRELAPGTKLEILGESAGWNEVRTADGQRGYVWAGWLTEGEAVPKPPEGARLPDASQARS
ncbi:MAG: SH3 domain-containing protein, partial [Deltaproteobacteria bacterium]